MNKIIQIVGDVAIDHFYHTMPQQDKGENWQLYPSLQTTLQPGGAFMLAGFIREALNNAGSKATVIGQKIPRNLIGSEARKMIQAKVLLDRYEDEDRKTGKKAIFRVQKFNGYSAPEGKIPIMPSYEKDDRPVNLLVLDDAGNGFRNQEKDFPPAIDNENTFVVYKMSRPLAQGKLWEKVCSRKGDWVLVLRANDLRLCENVHVSKALSWERTAMEMAWQLKRNPSLDVLRNASWLVVLFGTDGALLLSRNQNEKPLLIFDPDNLEGGFASSLKGKGMSGGAIFTTMLSVALLKEGPGGLTKGIKSGLSAMRNLLKQGFVLSGQEVVYPLDKVLNGERFNYSECALPVTHDLNSADPVYWRILDEKTRLSKSLVTIDIIKKKKPDILGEVPVGRYGKLQTFDRSEVEQFSAIRNLILEYFDDPKTSRPLCIAVFGPPGSGKSFGVKQVLSSMGRGEIPTMTFNISQYASYNDLVADFHKVRDKVLTGTVPVAFFDEFDSNEGDRQLGWLKYFLSPMQDGEFKEGEAIHPIGKSIFVFAGGTRSSFRHFEHNIGIDSDRNEQGSDKERMARFREAKGPDFVSRLRGFINILGPNPNIQEGKADTTYMIRRAKILRETFATTQKTQMLFSNDGELRIDESVLRAMLNIPEYRHGNRSMSALLDMSRLVGKQKFDLSALPTPDQLDMHVDKQLFLWLAGHERFYSLLLPEDRFSPEEISPMEWEQNLIDRIAEKMHEDYCNRRKFHVQDTPTRVSWADLTANKKKSNLDAASEIPVKLSMIGFGIKLLNENELPVTPDISDEEVELLARCEHERWCREQLIQGWKYGLIRNDAEKIHPDLLSWDLLPEAEKQKDFEAVFAMPRILYEAGIGIYRAESYEVIDESLISRIAVAIHEDYCKRRFAEGQTVESNPNLVQFNQLSEGTKDANLDSARNIPKKLKKLNITLHKASPGTTPELFVLTEKEIELLSEWEHARWNWHKIMQGWVYGVEKDETVKTHPHLVSWKELPDSIKEYDRENVRLIPGFIRDAGYEAIRQQSR